VFRRRGDCHHNPSKVRSGRPGDGRRPCFRFGRFVTARPFRLLACGSWWRNPSDFTGEYAWSRSAVSFRLLSPQQKPIHHRRCRSSHAVPTSKKDRIVIKFSNSERIVTLKLERNLRESSMTHERKSDLALVRFVGSTVYLRQETELFVRTMSDSIVGWLPNLRTQGVCRVVTKISGFSEPFLGRPSFVRRRPGGRCCGWFPPPLPRRRRRSVQ
jgi:hypothetical protein